MFWRSLRGKGACNGDDAAGSSLVRGDKIDRRRIQRLGQFPQADHGGVAPSAFQIAEILLREAGALGQLLLRQPQRIPQPSHIPSHDLPHVHARERDGGGWTGLSTIVCISPIRLAGERVVEGPRTRQVLARMLGST